MKHIDITAYAAAGFLFYCMIYMFLHMVALV